MSAAHARGQEESATSAPGSPAAAHSDTLFAHQLLLLNQPDLVVAELANAAGGGAPAENLWKAQAILATWDTITKSTVDRAGAERDYLRAMPAYLDSQAVGGAGGSEAIDGVWALDHAKFIFARLSENVLNRMEYWENNAKDRQALAPMAGLARRLLEQAKTSLDAGLHEAEGHHPFDEVMYTRDFNSLVEVEYYGVWSEYFQAMAMEPGDAARKKMLLAGASAVGKWADDKQDNGVNNQALLLRGKMRSEAGDFDQAAADLTRAAQNANAPAWVRYQARYQLVVARLRAGTYSAANTELDYFRKSLPQNNLDAQMSTEMLAYRVAWAEAGTKEGDDRAKAQAAALGILANILQRDPRFRDLVYQQLAGQIPDDANVDALLPMQQLAVAYVHSQGQKGDTPESRAELSRAAAAAGAVHDNPAASAGDKLEATFLAGVTNGMLNNLAAAARYNVEFAEQAPNDPRAKPLLDAALEQIGELRKKAASGGGTGDADAAALLNLQGRALTLATDNFHDVKWRYAQGRTLEDAGKLDDATKIFESIPETDKNYLDARFRLVAIATARFNALPARYAESDVRAAATALFSACSRYVSILEDAPKTLDPTTVARAKSYRIDIWLIETSTALNPIVKQPDIALDRLAKLDGVSDQLTAAQRAAILRYRIQAYQMQGEWDKAFAVVEQYAKGQGKDVNDVVRTMAYATLQEISNAKKTDPEHARQLASYVVKLLDKLIQASADDPAKKDAIYDYQKLQSDMLLRAGNFAEAQALAVKLQSVRPADLFNFMTEARALFEEARGSADAKLYAEAEDEFTRILPQVTNGGESFWECWLRILEAKEILGAGKADVADEIKRRLNDLLAGFGDKIGGDEFKAEFSRMEEKYAITEGH